MTISFNSLSNFDSTTSSASRSGLAAAVGDVMIVGIYSPAGRTVTGISGVAASWTQQAALSITGNPGTFYVYTGPVTTATSNGTITVTLSGSSPVFISYASCSGSGGSLDTTTGVVTKTGGSNETVTTGNISTSSASDGIAVICAYSANDAAGGTPSAGYSLLGTTASGETAIMTSVPGTVQTNAVATLSVSANSQWGSVVLAFAPVFVPPTGTWASTEAKDTMSAHGMLPVNAAITTTLKPITQTANVKAADTTTISMTLKPMTQTVNAHFEIPTGVGITTNFTGFSQTLDANEVEPVDITTTLLSFGQAVDVLSTVVTEIAQIRMTLPALTQTINVKEYEFCHISMTLSALVSSSPAKAFEPPLPGAYYAFWT